MAQRVTAGGMRLFTLIWFGQLVSLTGSGLTGFVLGVWVYQLTESATQFALIFVCAVLPRVVLSPLAGALVDRWDRRWVMIGSDSGAGLSTLAIALLFATGQLDVWHIYLATAVNSACSAFQLPAYQSIIPLMVPREQLGRANGMVQAAYAAQIISPMVAGVLVALITIPGVILIDVATFLFAVSILLLVRIPKPPITAEGRAARGSLWREMAYGWAYIATRPGLVWLVVLFGAINFLVGIASVLVQPLILSFASVAVLGILMFFGGSGLLAGGLVMSAWGGPKRRVLGMLGFILIGGAFLVLHGLSPSAVLIAVAAPGFLFTIPIINGSGMTILQSKVAPDVQGRVFATAGMIRQASAPLAYLVAGPLADGVFEPLLAPGGPLAGSVGQVIGVGPGRGIALMFILVGALTVVVAAAGYLQPRLRLVEEELPDMIPGAAPASEESVRQDQAGQQPAYEN